MIRRYLVKSAAQVAEEAQCLRDFAEHVPAPHVGLHVKVPVARQVAFARGQATLREVRMAVRTKLAQHIEQLRDVLERTSVDDLEIQRRHRRPVQHARRAADDDELDAGLAENFEQFGDLLRRHRHLRHAARRLQTSCHRVKLVSHLHRAMQMLHRRQFQHVSEQPAIDVGYRSQHTGIMLGQECPNLRNRIVAHTAHLPRMQVGSNRERGDKGATTMFLAIANASASRL